MMNCDPSMTLFFNIVILFSLVMCIIKLYDASHPSLGLPSPVQIVFRGE